MISTIAIAAAGVYAVWSMVKGIKNTINQKKQDKRAERFFNGCNDALKLLRYYTKRKGYMTYSDLAVDSGAVCGYDEARKILEFLKENGFVYQKSNKYRYFISDEYKD